MSARVGLGLRVEQRVAGEDHAGRAVAALQPVRLAERILQHAELAGAGAQALDGGTPWPSACTASIRQERTGSPSSRTVQAPHTPCSQPACVPLRPRVLAQAVEQRAARLDVHLDRPAVDLQLNAHAGLRLPGRVLRGSRVAPGWRRRACDRRHVA